MATRMLPDSPRLPLAREFAELLRRTRKRRGASTRSLAAAVGLSRTQICDYERGCNLPQLERAIRLADALEEPRLLEIVRRSLSRPCKICGAEIVTSAGRPAIYCGEPCRRLAQPMKRNVVERRLALYRDEVVAIRAAIGAFCNACPDGSDGVCRVAECELRSVSPLPYGVDRYAVRGARGTGGASR